MKTGNPAWWLILFILLFIIPAVACQQPKLPAATVTDNTSLQTVYEIPEGTAPQRPETYDDIVFCELFYTYRANCPYVIHTEGPGWPTAVPGPDFVREVEVTLSGCQFAPSVRYRDNIVTKAGEIRYNKFYIALQTSSVNTDELALIRKQTGKPPVDYEVKQRGTSPDIRVRQIGEGHPDPWGSWFGNTVFYITIEISPQVKPGDYMLHFIVEANGQNCGELPCIIHVTE